MEEHGDCHGTYPSWDGGDVRGDGKNAFKVDIPDDLVLYAVNADIDHDGTGLDHVRPNQGGNSNRGDKNICGSGDFKEAFGTVVADGNCRIAALFFLHEHGRERLPDNVATAEDNDVFSLDGNAASFEKNFDSKRGTGKEGRFIAQEHFPDVQRMKSVYVFSWIDRKHDSLGIDMGGQGKLNEEGVDGRISIESLDLSNEISFCDRRGKLEQSGSDSGRSACFFFGANVALGGGIFTD